MTTNTHIYTKTETPIDGDTKKTFTRTHIHTISQNCPNLIGVVNNLEKNFLVVSEGVFKICHALSDIKPSPL